MLIPEQAVLAEGGSTFVFTVADGRAERREVAARPARGAARSRCSTGSRPASWWCASGLQRLRDGAAVQVPTDRRRAGRRSEGQSVMISDFCIKRPVFAAVLSLLIVVLGIASLLRLPVRELPDVDCRGRRRDHRLHRRRARDRRYRHHRGDRGRGRRHRRRQDDLVAEPARPRPHGDRVRARPQHRRGGQRRARRGRAGARRPARRGRRAADHQERQRRRPGDADRDHQRPAERRPRSPTTSSASSSTGCRPWMASPRSRSSASGASRSGIWLDRRAMAARNLTVDDVESALRRNNVELPAGELKSTIAPVHRARRQPAVDGRAVRDAS